MINQVILVGRLTKDLELKHTANGVAFINFTIAVNRKFTSNDGNREADFINCVVWRQQAENMAKFVGKGSLIGVTGAIQTRHYDGNDGKRVYVTEVRAESVQYLDKKKKNEHPAPDDGQAPPAYQNQGVYNETGSRDFDPVVDDDDLPF